MTKYTIAVNDFEYLESLYDTEEEAENYILKVVKEKGYTCEDEWKEDDYYKDKPFKEYVLDMAQDTGLYRVMEIM